MGIDSGNPVPFWRRIILPFLAGISIEPVFLLDGFAFSNMIVLVEALQFDKICKVNLNFTEEICNNLDDYVDEKNNYTLQVSNFKRNDGAITSIIPLFFILFIGAWSDKYGRKVPLCLTLSCHLLFSAGYLLNSSLFYLPVEFLLFVGFLDSIGGGAVAFLTVSNAYISDVTTKEQRTSKVALANSLWFLGGPLGTLIGTQIYSSGGYNAVFATSLSLYCIALIYVLVLLPESHGPFCNKKRMRKISKQHSTLMFRETIMRVYGLSKRKKNTLGQTKSEEEKEKKKLTAKKMFLDFFDLKRVVMSFKCVFRKRDGYTRFFIFMLILSNFLRKIGRGAYAFVFAKDVLKWESQDYGYWSTYKNFISTMGSLLAVPILSTRLKVSDNTLAMIGSLSSVVDYIFYGLVTPATYFFMWIGPVAALLINSCSIAMRAMMSKYVNADELGQVSAVTGTLEGVVPIISTTMYSAITSRTFDTYPGAQYFFGAGCNLLMALIFVLIMMMDKGAQYDVENATPKKAKGPVREKGLVCHTDSNWLFDQCNNGKIRLATILLTALNFSIEIPSIERAFSNKGRKQSTLSTLLEEAKVEGVVNGSFQNTEDLPDGFTEIPEVDSNPVGETKEETKIEELHKKEEVDKEKDESNSNKESEKVNKKNEERGKENEEDNKKNEENSKKNEENSKENEENSKENEENSKTNEENSKENEENSLANEESKKEKEYNSKENETAKESSVPPPQDGNERSKE